MEDKTTGTNTAASSNKNKAKTDNLDNYKTIKKTHLAWGYYYWTFQVVLPPRTITQLGR